MAQSYTTMVGTVGTGIWVSHDGGERWGRSQGHVERDAGVRPHPSPAGP